MPSSTLNSPTKPRYKSRRPSLTALFTNSFITANSSNRQSPTSTITSPCDTTSPSTPSLNATNPVDPTTPGSVTDPASPSSAMSRKMQRSYSQSHARTGSYMMSSHAAAPSLGQGAIVVRTPSDATMFMAQPGAQGPFPMSRQSSLRSPPRRPSDGGQLPEYFAPRVDGNPAPLLPPVHVNGAPSISADLRDVFTSDGGRASATHGRQPSRTLSRSPSAPHSSRGLVDASTGYHPARRVTQRPSLAVLQPSASLSRATGRGGPSPTPSFASSWVNLPRSDSRMSTTTTSTATVRRPAPSPPASPQRGVSPTLCRDPSCTRLNTPTHVHFQRPSNASEDTLTTPRIRTVMPPPSAPLSTSPVVETPPPILVSHNVRPTHEAGSVVLVTLRFGFSLESEPNTHAVTVTLDTLRPAGGRLIEFVEKVLHPVPNTVPHSPGRDSGIGGSGSGTPLTSHSSPEPSLEMTDGSSAEDSDFEYDNGLRHPNLLDEYAVAQTLAAAPKQPSAPDAPPPRPARRQYPPPTAYPYAGLPPLADLPAALAQAKAAAEANMQQSQRTGRRRASTCPGPAIGVVHEITILLQREAGAWHAIASRLCSGSWPNLDGRRRRIEDECKWAGMDGLVAELRKANAVVDKTTGRSYI